MSATSGGPEPSNPEVESRKDKELAFRIDLIARKYFSVWVWSIIVGIVTTTTISLINYHPIARGSYLIVLTVPLLLIASLCAAAAWMFIIRFLAVFILPTFFESKAYPGDPARILLTAVRWSVLSILFRLALAVTDLLLSS